MGSYLVHATITSTPHSFIACWQDRTQSRSISWLLLLLSWRRKLRRSMRLPLVLGSMSEGISKSMDLSVLAVPKMRISKEPSLETCTLEIPLLFPWQVIFGEPLSSYSLDCVVLVTLVVWVLDIQIIARAGVCSRSICSCTSTTKPCTPKSPKSCNHSRPATIQMHSLDPLRLPTKPETHRNSKPENALHPTQPNSPSHSHICRQIVPFSGGLHMTVPEVPGSWYSCNFAGSVWVSRRVFLFIDIYIYMYVYAFAYLC